jgi:ribosome-associated translation inhibitor RaiA
MVFDSASEKLQKKLQKLRRRKTIKCNVTGAYEMP